MPGLKHFVGLLVSGYTGFNKHQFLSISPRICWLTKTSNQGCGFLCFRPLNIFSWYAPMLEPRLPRLYVLPWCPASPEYPQHGGKALGTAETLRKDQATIPNVWDECVREALASHVHHTNKTHKQQQPTQITQIALYPLKSLERLDICGRFGTSALAWKDFAQKVFIVGLDHRTSKRPHSRLEHAKEHRNTGD